MEQKYDIFISYRREGGQDAAHELCDRLKRDGYKVSFDQDNLGNGDFNKQLLQRIEECDDFILICDANVFDKMSSDKSEKDWLRIELAKALELDKNIIPIMLSGFTSFPKNLPSDIEQVRFKNGPQYSIAYYETFYERLKQFFKAAISDDNVMFENASSSLKANLRIERGWLYYGQEKYDKAMECFLDAAEMGSANAINAIAIYYYEGRGNEKNLQKAAQWFRYAAEMGYASAQRNLGDCLRKGEGVPQNMEEAFAWYMRAAEKENIKAQYSLGECYEHGWGVVKDEANARHWFKTAADQGYEPAILKLK
jgi:tetratricopeptide (TPR) repeat protein